MSLEGPGIKINPEYCPQPINRAYWLREFAGRAMQASLTLSRRVESLTAEEAVSYAQALLAEIERREAETK